MEQDAHPPANVSGQQAISRSRTAKEEENGELVRGVNVLEQLNAHMETDDNDNEARIASQYRMLTMHDSEFLTVPEADDENISTRDARHVLRLGPCACLVSRCPSSYVCT